MRLVLALVLLVSVAPPASAKCVGRFFVISGVVLDAKGAPASGAVVGVSWADFFGPSGPALAMTGQDGRYSVPLKFETYSGQSFFSGDQCEGRLKQISVSAYSTTHRSPFTLVPVDEQWQINVEPLRIDTEIQRKPLWPDEIGG